MRPLVLPLLARVQEFNFATGQWITLASCTNTQTAIEATTRVLANRGRTLWVKRGEERYIHIRKLTI